MKNCFLRSDILLPRIGIDLEKWCTIACDQYTSDPSYWQKVESFTGDSPSCLRMVLPELYLGQADTEARVIKIQKTMASYEQDCLYTVHDAYMYVERTQPDGRVRHGIVGMIDLEAYNYNVGSTSPVRATEGTVLSRIPPRVAIRQGASLEIPHIMLLCNDKEDGIFTYLRDNADHLPLAYQTVLPMHGGSVSGRICRREAADAISNALESLASKTRDGGILYAVGDGNHSLATAKKCYEDIKATLPREAAEKHPARYALCELVNIYDAALSFEPIYRVLFGVNTDDVLHALASYRGNSGDCHTFRCITADKEQTICLSTQDKTELPVAALQAFIDDYMDAHPTATVDYIHGEAETRALASKDGAIGFLFAGMKKNELFPSVEQQGALPRKTFSMGEANDKRFYLEARRILPLQ